MVLLGQDVEIVYTPEQLRLFPTFSPSGTTDVADNTIIKVGLAKPRTDVSPEPRCHQRSVPKSGGCNLIGCRPERRLPLQLGFSGPCTRCCRGQAAFFLAANGRTPCEICDERQTRRRDDMAPDSRGVAPSASWRNPRPGHSKTRLCPPLRPEQAARLSAAFLRDTTQNIAAAALSAPIAGYAAYAPSGTEEALIPHLALGTSCVLADGSTLPCRAWEGFGRSSSMQSSNCLRRVTPPRAC